MRYIIECDDPADIVLGAKVIRNLMNNLPQNDSVIIEFSDASLWYVRKTKTGYSARRSGE